MPEISVRANGPYAVTDVPVQRRRIVKSENDESIDWETTALVETPETVFLCRCGGSSTKPICDGSHAKNGFVAEDAAPPLYAEHSKALGGTVRDDRSICVHAAFCTNKVTNVWKLAKDEEARAQAVAMIDKCPSGALTYDREPDLAVAISAIDDGPLWVTGGVPVTLPDGTTIETRNRMTLCRCGAPSTKPLCDGSHSEAGFRDA